MVEFGFLMEIHFGLFPKGPGTKSGLRQNILQLKDQ